MTFILPNCIKVTIETNESGFTVWAGEGKNMTWIIDASTIAEDGRIRFGIGMGLFGLFRRGKPLTGEYEVKAAQ